MHLDPDTCEWGFDAAIQLLRSPAPPRHRLTEPVPTPTRELEEVQTSEEEGGLGSFGELWEYFRQIRLARSSTAERDTPVWPETFNVGRAHPRDGSAEEEDKNTSGPGDDENADRATSRVLASLKTRKRADRRARARERVAVQLGQHLFTADTPTELESGEELEKLRRSPDRTALIAELVGRPRPKPKIDTTPPTSPSPPKGKLGTSASPWPISNPFSWQIAAASPYSRTTVGPKDGLTPELRKKELIARLLSQFSDEKRFLKNAGLPEPAFTALNVSDRGIHIFVDISNIMIGFHDCLKAARDIPRETRIRRVPLEFHNFSLILERGRPAAKRVLVGSDRFPVVQQAKSIGYETNILERVHKAKELKSTLHAKKIRPGKAAGSGRETGGSGSETNVAVQKAAEKWVEQAVDEILHLKILESLVDAERPGTIVLATGDAAEAEYSGGFMRMVVRALEKGWMIELVSFRLNTSSAYLRNEFRGRWGKMFRWIMLDEWVEFLIDEE